MSALRYYSPPEGVPVPRRIEVDVCCYGSSPAAVTAALEARRRGLRVALVVNAARPGGLTTGGLSNTDIGKRAVIGGLAREFYRRVGAHYGVQEEWRFEPHVAARVLDDWLREAGVRPFLREYPRAVLRAGARLRELQCESGLAVQADYFIDASYEGDLLGLAGVDYRVGRESNAEHGESHNGVQVFSTHQFEHPVDPYRIEGQPASGLLPGIHPEPLAARGTGDRKVQAYNFRLCLTQAPDRLPFTRPETYSSINYELFARYLRAGWRDLFRKFDRIRGGKADVNNHGAISTDCVGASWEFPEAGWRRREEIFQAHVAWQRGWLWFLATDPRVPEALRRTFLTWGLPRDEFVSTEGWPPQLYIRESRRLVGAYTITELDCLGRRRSDDGVGMGAYAMDSHNCQRVVRDGRVLNEGDVQLSGFAPYPISYRALTPRRSQAENLLVPVCVSATHIAFGSVRMEPVFMILGQSAAVAIALARAAGTAVQEVPYAELRGALEAVGQVLAWAPDRHEAAAYEPEAPPPEASLTW